MSGYCEKHNIFFKLECSKCVGEDMKWATGKTCDKCGKRYTISNLGGQCACELTSQADGVRFTITDSRDLTVNGSAFISSERDYNPHSLVPGDTSELLKFFDAPVQESPTGSLRFNNGKPQTNEISPSFLLDMGRVLEKSRQKYPRGNWEKGNDYSVPYDSLMRHLLAWQSGESIDKESGQKHLAHAALNLMMLHYYEENYPEFDDRIFKKEKK